MLVANAGRLSCAGNNLTVSDNTRQYLDNGTQADVSTSATEQRQLPTCMSDLQGLFQPALTNLRNYTTHITKDAITENSKLRVGYHVTCHLLCLLMHLVHNDRAPVYLADSVTATANISRRIRLRSASSFRYEQPRTRLKLGERCYRLRRPGCLEQSAIIHSRTVQ